MACRSTTGRVRPPGDGADGRGHAVRGMLQWVVGREMDGGGEMCTVPVSRETFLKTMRKSSSSVTCSSYQKPLHRVFVCNAMILPVSPPSRGQIISRLSFSSARFVHAPRSSLVHFRGRCSDAFKAGDSFTVGWWGHVWTALKPCNKPRGGQTSR